jgi:hypothetical protein
MRFLLALSLCLVSCAHVPHASTLPSFAVQCQETRDVVCLADKDFPNCAALTQASIKAINEAIGRDVYRFAGVLVTQEQAKDRYNAGLVVVGADKLPANILGVTQPVVELDHKAQQACIAKVLVVLDSVSLKGVYYDMQRVLTHELIHALGFDHASPSASVGSIMAVPYSNHSKSISAGDRTSLRAVYNP